MRTCGHVCACTCGHVCACTCARTHTHTHTHTYFLSERNKFFCSKLWFLKLSIGREVGWTGELKTTMVEAGGAPLQRHFLICSNCRYRELDGIHFYDEGINGYGENRVQVEDLNPKKGIKPWNSNEKLLYKHKGNLFYTCKTKCINMNQMLPLGNGDCAFNSPRQIWSALSLPSIHSNEDLAPAGGSRVPPRLATSSLRLGTFWLPQSPQEGAGLLNLHPWTRSSQRLPSSSGMLWSCCPHPPTHPHGLPYKI